MTELSRLDITLPSSHTEEEAELLQGCLALRVSHGWEESSLPTGEFRCRVHSAIPELCEDLRREVGELLPTAVFALSRVEDKNWMEAWKAFFTPVEAGEFLVLAPWMQEELARTTRLPIIIEPKTAFGTGHHATTALCLQAISRLHGAGKLRAGMRFLDLGTGSGILGIACAKLGLTGEGLDIDPPAIANAEENRAINGIAAEDFPLALGSVEKSAGSYDIILANILAGPLRDMAEALAALRSPQGERPLLVLSGLLDIQADSVEAAYGAAGLPQPERLQEGEWMALIFG
jgi:ribosomal protein L11 methyltransferase